MSEPLAAVDVWRPVMEAAGHRCQCTGACGNPHSKGGGRCPREHDGYTSKHGHRVRLMAAPADPLTPPATAVALPVGELLAWCPECQAAAVRQARKVAPVEDAPGLFDL
ncbi:hypothetical protein SLINC_5732 [Streptomyces lincolnensis]|uniref:Uncharacterized protein n=1 Tax=Streptomyces lincolnensis TaxID=1915 RepID=A0A1B1MH48_STRLN|nr:hypothetical protein [Streptomyces lincolnensis]ANS67956.1 hypothetical protein SLINC_5732 [Streptomyces lincolnensis]AXG53839.1 hypothetical protein SLCG_2684 [Streptomyces lincolnensis]QMV09612.1 hypothetical protein GJU35_30805 [Streptomyces lincolnensis]